MWKQLAQPATPTAQKKVDTRHIMHREKKIQKRVRPGTLLGYDMPQYSYILKNV